MRARLYAAFSSPDGVLKRKGPFERLLFEVEVVRERAAGPVIARHKDHEWHVDAERFTRLDVEGLVELQFVDGVKSEPHEPFALFSSVGGVAYREAEVLAYVDLRRNVWIRHADGQEWPLLLVEPAG